MPRLKRNKTVAEAFEAAAWRSWLGRELHKFGEGEAHSGASGLSGFRCRDGASAFLTRPEDFKERRDGCKIQGLFWVPSKQASCRLP